MAFDHITSTMPAFGTEHDYRHALREGAHAREGLVLMLQFPERGIAGFIYPWINANGTASAAVCLFGPALRAPIQERFEEVEVAPDMDFHDWRVAGLRIRIDEPHVSANYSFHGERVKIDCRFEALHPVYAFSFHPDGCPPYYADDRTEQHGRITGTMEIDGERFTFSALAQRDHAWGNRVWGLNQHYKWFHATTERAAVHFFEMQSFGARHVLGFVCKDGAMAQVVSVQHEYRFDETMHHMAINAIVHDDLGRTTLVEGTTFAKYQFEADPKVMLNESAITVKIEGAEGTGWCEFCWNRDYLDFARQHVTKFQPYPELLLSA